MDLEQENKPKKKRYGRGVVVWACDPFKSSENGEDVTRPWVLVSNRNHPFKYQWIGMAITTKNHERSIPITNDDWIQGKLDTQSFVSPWSVATISSDDIWSYVGTLNEEFVDEIIDSFDELTISNRKR